MATRPVYGDSCPVGGCEFSSTTVTTTSTTLPAELVWLQALVDDMQALPRPFAGPVVLRGTAFTAGRLRATIWSSTSGHPDSALVARGHAKIRRPGAFRLKLHPTRFGRVYGGESTLTFEARQRTGFGTRRRTNVRWPRGPGPYCCDFGPGGACRGGLDPDACESMRGGALSGDSCAASGECEPPPGAPGSCCDDVPSQPGVCGAPADASACVDAGGTFHPASVCQPSGTCAP